MTPADTPDDSSPTDPASPDDAPITPEVIDGGGASSAGRRGAAARKRRMGQPAGDGPAPDDAAPPPRRPLRESRGGWFRAGCMLLVVLGAFELFIFSRFVYDPEAVRCDAAQFQIDEANEDDEDFNDVDLPEGTTDAEDLGCETAIREAGNIPDDEDEAADGEFVEASAFRTQGLIFSALGLAHAASGILLLRTKARRVRTAALVFTAVGMLTLSQFGIFGIVALAFIVYALAFSADARVMFPPPAGGGGFGGLFRPRPPRANS